MGNGMDMSRHNVQTNQCIKDYIEKERKKVYASSRMQITVKK